MLNSIDIGDILIDAFFENPRIYLVIKKEKLETDEYVYCELFEINKNRTTFFEEWYLENYCRKLC